MVRKAPLIPCIAVLFLVQAAIVPRFSHRFLRPDLLLLAAAFLTLEADLGTALWGAFALGLLRDLGSTGPLGATPLLLLPLSAGLHHLKAHLVRDSFWTDLLLTLGYLLAFGLLSPLLAAALTAGAPARLLAAGLGQAAFTTALSPLLFLAFLRLRLVQPGRTH